MRSNNASMRPGTGLEDSMGPKTQFINTQGSIGSLGNTGSASLKGKLLNLEELVRSITEEMNFHKKEVQILRSEKDTLENVLNMKINDVRKSLMNEIARVEDEMKRHFAHQKAENSRLQQQITQLKGEKTSLQQQLLALQRRISELETQIGAEDS
jgi:chromosome segregation ATPase